MKVLVLGAGVVGATAAWYLSKAGVEVEVIERQAAAGLETSFANGAQLSACAAIEPWATPATVRKALGWLGQEDAPLILRWRRWDPLMWQWLARFLLNSTNHAAALHGDRMLRMALYSRHCIQALRKEVPLDFDVLSKGILMIYRNPQIFDQQRASIEVTSRVGLVRHALTPAQAIEIEPSLAAMGASLVGGIHTPDDESGDALKFSQQIAAAAEQRGVRFHYGCTILNLEWDKGRVSGVATSAGRFRADAYLLATGSWAPFLARQVGITLPIYPAKGYSATLGIRQPDKVTTVSLIDEEYKVVYSRLGDRLRVAGTAELAGWDETLAPVRARKMLEHTRAQFPAEALDFSEPALWAGLRPVTPDSVPILGATRIPNLYLNCGHGTLGWTMACGSGKVLADIITGRPADIDLTGFGIDRFRRWWPPSAAS